MVENKAWHNYYRANTSRWLDADGEFINCTLLPVVVHKTDANGQMLSEVQCVGYYLGQLVRNQDGSLKRYSNPVLVYVDCFEPLKGLKLGDKVKLNGLRSYYVKGFERKYKDRSVYYKGHANFRADGIRKVSD